MNELNRYAVLSELDEDIIESTLPPSLSGVPTAPRPKGDSFLSRLMSNGWVAAVLSAVVAVAVIVAIVMAGRGDGPFVPPAGSVGGSEGETDVTDVMSNYLFVGYRFSNDPSSDQRDALVVSWYHSYTKLDEQGATVTVDNGRYPFKTDDESIKYPSDVRQMSPGTSPVITNIVQDGWTYSATAEVYDTAWNPITECDLADLSLLGEGSYIVIVNYRGEGTEPDKAGYTSFWLESILWIDVTREAETVDATETAPPPETEPLEPGQYPLDDLPALDPACPLAFSVELTDPGEGYKRGSVLTIEVTMENKTESPITFTANSLEYYLPYLRLIATRLDGERRVVYDSKEFIILDGMEPHELTFSPGQSRTQEWQVYIPEDAPTGAYYLTAYYRPRPAWYEAYESPLFVMGEAGNLEADCLSVSLTSGNGTYMISPEAHYRHFAYIVPEIGDIMIHEQDWRLWESYIEGDLVTLELPQGTVPTVGHKMYSFDGWTDSAEVYIYDTEKTLIAEGELSELSSLPVGTYFVAMGLRGTGPWLSTGLCEAFWLGFGFRLVVIDEDIAEPDCLPFWYEHAVDAPNGYARGASFTVHAAMQYMHDRVIFFDAPASEVYPRVKVYCLLADGTEYRIDTPPANADEIVQVTCRSGDRLSQDVTVLIPEDAPAGTYYLEIDCHYMASYDDPDRSILFTLS